MNTPKIRFKGFEDDWEQRKLGEMVSLRGRIGFRGYTQNDLVGEGDGAITFSPADIDNDGNVSLEGNKYLTWEKYEESPEIKVQIGDILFTKTASIGKVGYVRELKEKATINPQFALLTPNEKANGYFTFLSVRNNVFMKQVRSITGGSSVPTMSQEKLKELTFMTPSLEEQKKIGEYFEKLDYLITLHQRKCDETKQLKKFMLQKMFQKNGEKNPEIRFEGFTDDWEQRKLGEIVLRESLARESTIDLPYVEYEDVIAEEGRINKDIRKKEGIKKGIFFDGSQVLYGKLRPYLHNWLNPDFSGVAVGDWWVLKPNNVDKNFIYRLIQTQQFDDIANQSTGSKMPRADWNLVSNTEFAIPTSQVEQTKIGGYFFTLDNLITLHQRKCEKLKELKKYMLQNMFV